MDALLSKSKEKDGKKAEGIFGPSIDKAREFLEEAKMCNESRFKSIGYGWDHRFEGLAIVGSVLVSHEKVIHMAFFKSRENGRVEEDNGRMSGFGRRRGFRV